MGACRSIDLSFEKYMQLRHHLSTSSTSSTSAKQLQLYQHRPRRIGEAFVQRLWRLREITITKIKTKNKKKNKPTFDIGGLVSKEERERERERVKKERATLKSKKEGTGGRGSVRASLVSE